MQGQTLAIEDQRLINAREVDILVQSADLRSLYVPLYTQERFAEIIGLPVGVIRAQIKRGYFPVVRIGRYTFINIPQLNQKLLNNPLKGE